MRYFTLTNSAGNELDITTTEIFFHEISGLGFEEETSFRTVGDVWWLDRAAYRQKPICGKVSFTENGDTDPYSKFFNFANFVREAPLELIYYPFGLSNRETMYKRRVRVTKLEKSEKNLYGVLEEAIEFTPYTPWYKVIKLMNGSLPGSEELELTGWIWGDSDEESSVPLAFSTFSDENDPDATSECYVERNGVRVEATRPQFGWEALPTIDFPKIQNGSRNPVKLTIHGPCVDPIWTLRNGNDIYATGGFAESFSLNELQTLVIDNTNGRYSMNVYTAYTNVVNDVYQLRDFDRECFFYLPQGANSISVTDQGGADIQFEVEGHIYYGTV